jgi:hypothetical protein
MHLRPPNLLVVWLFSAVFVTVVRALHVVDLGYDLTLQIQAAQNLLHGEGLSIYPPNFASDLAEPSQLITLTHFSAGYSFIVAALLAAGLNMPVIFKLIAGAGTMLGWWGWAKLGQPFFDPGLKRTGIWQWTALAIALITPLLFTPSWHGTDLLLWACVPWVLLWLTRPAGAKTERNGWYDFAAGAICGLAVLLRYQGLFLLGYAGFLILSQSLTRPLTLLRRASAFVIGVLPLLAVQFYLNYFVSEVDVRPGGVTFKADPWTGGQHILLAFGHITSANFALLWWMPEKFLRFFIQPVAKAPWLLIVTLGGFIFWPLWLALRAGCRGPSSASRDTRTVAAGLLMAIVLFLLGCAVSRPNYFGVTRYYVPVLPVAVFIAYALALPNGGRKRWTRRAEQITSTGYITGYVCIGLLELGCLLSPGERGSWRRTELAETRRFEHSLPLQPLYALNPSRNYLIKLLREEPNTVLVTNVEQQFYADPEIDRSRVHRLQGLNSPCVSGPTRILIFVAEPFEGPIESLYWMDAGGKPRPANNFAGVSDLYLVKRFPEEKIKILEWRVPAGTRTDLTTSKESKI